MKSPCFGPQLHVSRHCPFKMGRFQPILTFHEIQGVEVLMDDELVAPEEEENIENCNFVKSGRQEVGNYIDHGTPNKAKQVEIENRRSQLITRLQREVDKLIPDVDPLKVKLIQECITKSPKLLLSELEGFRKNWSSGAHSRAIDRMIELANKIILNGTSESPVISPQAQKHFSIFPYRGGDTTRTTVIYRQQEDILKQFASKEDPGGRFGLLISQLLESKGGDGTSPTPLSPRKQAKTAEFLHLRYARALEKCKTKFQPFFPSQDHYSRLCYEESIHPSVITELIADKVDAECYMAAIQSYKQSQMVSKTHKVAGTPNTQI
jgi:hypothetical protein